MKLQPRQQLLGIWRAIAHTCYQDGGWVWGGRDPSNSISDAEQLLCLMSPATGVRAFRLDRPDETGEDVLGALRNLGDSVEIPRLLIRVLTEYMERYTDESGRPTFSGDGFFLSEQPDVEPTERQRNLEVVDSFSTSVALSLATIGFVRVFRELVRREGTRREIDALEAMASRRLSAAMVGLLRSFTVNVFPADTGQGRILCRTVNQNGLPEREVVRELRQSLRTISARLRDVTIGSGSGSADDLDDPNRLFECGWSWGTVRGAPRIATTEDVGTQPDGVAEEAPYLYFTVVALDGIAALFSERTRLLGLLNEEQSRLAQALQIRWELTQSYWSTIASFGTRRWPLEDIPWRTTDGEESDYFSLLVTTITTQDLIRRRAADPELSRVGQVLLELATRARVTRRPFDADPAVALHSPGVRITLVGSADAGDCQLAWQVSDFSPRLLWRAVSIAGLLRGTEERDRLLRLADGVWDHLSGRRLTAEAGQGLWDEPGNVFTQIPDRYGITSWYYTKRVVDCLVAATRMVNSPPPRSDRVYGLAADMLSEADHRFDQELLGGSPDAGPAMRRELRRVADMLRRAHEQLPDHPGTTLALVSEVLRELDLLEAARQNASRTL
ncbi:MAG TPA: SCO2524 family protein [Mycobacteriales bacterium]